MNKYCSSDINYYRWMVVGKLSSLLEALGKQGVDMNFGERIYISVIHALDRTEPSAA